jgi:hypothetical protein
MTEASARQGFIVDPDDPTQAIVTPSGRMAGRVFIAPAGTDPLDTSAWRHIGFAGDPEPFPPRTQFQLKLSFRQADQDAEEA